MPPRSPGKQIIKLPSGYNIFWSGQYEYMLRAQQRLMLVVPLTLLIIILIIYLNTRSAIKTAIVMLAVPFSLVGAIGILALLHYKPERGKALAAWWWQAVAVVWWWWVAVYGWSGIYRAMAGLDARNRAGGDVACTCLDLAYEQWIKEGKMRNLVDLRDAIYHGAVKRVSSTQSA